MTASRTPGDTARTFGLPADERYTLFLSAAVQHGKVWTLMGEGGFVAFSDEAQHDCFPFWPDPAFAEALATEDWSDCRAEALDLKTFMERWLAGMSRDGRLVSVFPAPDGTAIVMDPLVLRQDLEEERQQAG